MLRRNNAPIAIKPIISPSNRPAMAQPMFRQHVIRAAAPAPAAEPELSDEIVTAAFPPGTQTRPAQARNMKGRQVPGAAPAKKKAPQNPVQRDVAGLSVSTMATIYGCCGLFDLCGDRDLMSLSFQGQDPLLDWLGWERTDVCLIKKYFIPWVRPEYDGATPTAGYVGDACADPSSVSWGVCDFILRDFARLRRQSPVRDITKGGLRRCEESPRYRLDGTPITDDREYDIRIVTEGVLQDLKRMLINGNASTPGQFDGLERLVKTGYLNSDGHNCQAMNSIVVNWGGNQLSSTTGVTWNGTTLSAGYTFIDVLLNVYRNIVQRIKMSPMLAAQQLQVGDIVLALPTAFIDCVLNAFTCWRVCQGTQYNEAVINTLEGRNFRNQLDGGMFGAGRIYLHGFEVPIMPYDYGLIKSPTRFDAYLLTGSVGNVKLLQGQYNDMSYAAGVRADRYGYLDGGRLLTYSQDDHTCERRVVEMQPRLLAWAPWAQARFQNLRCQPVGPIISGDPTETSFFIQQSFTDATCPV